MENAARTVRIIRRFQTLNETEFIMSFVNTPIGGTDSYGFTFEQRMSNVRAMNAFMDALKSCGLPVETAPDDESRHDTWRYYSASHRIVLNKHRTLYFEMDADADEPESGRILTLCNDKRVKTMMRNARRNLNSFDSLVDRLDDLGAEHLADLLRPFSSLITAEKGDA